jgi:hypothetical protein
MHTERGTKLLTSGWWGRSRHPVSQLNPVYRSDSTELPRRLDHGVCDLAFFCSLSDQIAWPGVCPPDLKLP